jgi:hypothetical protein
VLNGKATEKQFLDAYEICKLQASADGAFPEVLMEHWFRASWDLCASMIGFVYPPQQITETVVIRSDGSFRLSHEPSSEVKLYHGATLVMTLPPSLQRSGSPMCEPSLCCYCDLRAIYTIGEETCEMSPRFVQAVARLFTYIVENRGDVELDDQVLGKSGAKAWLGPDLEYVL